MVVVPWFSGSGGCGVYPRRRGTGLGGPTGRYNCPIIDPSSPLLPVETARPAPNRPHPPRMPQRHSSRDPGPQSSRPVELPEPQHFEQRQLEVPPHSLADLAARVLQLPEPLSQDPNQVRVRSAARSPLLDSHGNTEALRGHQPRLGHQCEHPVQQSWPPVPGCGGWRSRHRRSEPICAASTRQSLPGLHPMPRPPSETGRPVSVTPFASVPPGPRGSGSRSHPARSRAGKGRPGEPRTRGAFPPPGSRGRISAPAPGRIVSPASFGSWSITLSAASVCSACDGRPRQDRPQKRVRIDGVLAPDAVQRPHGPLDVLGGHRREDLRNLDPVEMDFRPWKKPDPVDQAVAGIVGSSPELAPVEPPGRRHAHERFSPRRPFRPPGPVDLPQPLGSVPGGEARPARLCFRLLGV